VTARDAAGTPPPQPDPPQPDAPRAGQAQPGEGKAAQPKKAQPKTGRPPVQQPSYEQARDELTELVKRLEAGGLTLEQSLELWERGERLASICNEWLEGARARLAAATAQRSEGDGDPAAPF
jgi:exodeoxyribonuclease VII small subunit